jgi:hypothetical protein
MNNVNNFFRKLYSSPPLIWKAGAGLMFVGLALAILFMPSLINGLTDNSRFAFAGLLGIYGMFRLMTFYTEYKRIEND